MDPRARAAPTDPARDDGGLRGRLYRYFFYGWLFRDADSGSALERSAALRHNVRQARWLPLYMLRWGVIGALLTVAEQLCERVDGFVPVCAALLVMLIVVVLFEMITLICWAFLKVTRQSR